MALNVGMLSEVDSAFNDHRISVTIYDIKVETKAVCLCFVYADIEKGVTN